jgi:hypothetical protein
MSLLIFLIAAVEPHVGHEEVFSYTFGKNIITYNKYCR